MLCQMQEFLIQGVKNDFFSKQKITIETKNMAASPVSFFWINGKKIDFVKSLSDLSVNDYFFCTK